MKKEWRYTLFRGMKVFCCCKSTNKFDILPVLSAKAQCKKFHLYSEQNDGFRKFWASSQTMQNTFRISFFLLFKLDLSFSKSCCHFFRRRWCTWRLNKWNIQDSFVSDPALSQDRAVIHGAWHWACHRSVSKKKVEALIVQMFVSLCRRKQNMGKDN